METRRKKMLLPENIGAKQAESQASPQPSLELSSWAHLCQAAKSAPTCGLHKYRATPRAGTVLAPQSTAVSNANPPSPHVALG